MRFYRILLGIEDANSYLPQKFNLKGGVKVATLHYLNDIYSHVALYPIRQQLQPPHTNNPFFFQK